MKKMKFMLFAVAAMVAASCAQEIDAPENQSQTEVGYVDLEYTSSLEGVTRTALSGNSVVWLGSESISIFDNSASPANTQAKTLSGTPGTFTASVPDATEYYAYYPYRKDAKMATAGTVTNCYLAQVQSPVKGGFDKERAPMMAKADADNNFAFKNVASHIRFTIPEDMTDVIALTLWGNADELITGVYDVEWNGGDPKVVISDVSQAYPYATLRAGNKSVLSPGDYYFTIFPTEFKKGFTVILSKSDQTQVAIRTDKPRTEVMLRNNILPMMQAASTAFKSHMNYYVHYDNGFDLDISGFTVNTTWASENSKKAVIVTDTKNNGNMAGKTGILYFVSSNCTTARLGSSTTWKDLFAIGTDASVRTPAQLGAHQNVSAESAYYVLANLNFTYMTPSSKHVFIRGNVAKLDYVIINNCSFNEIPAPPFNFDQASEHVAATVKSFIVEDCEFGYNMTTDSYLLRENSHADSHFGLVKVHNSIFYSVATIPGDKRFRLLYIGNSGEVGSNADEIVVTNNTFVDMRIKGAMNSVRNIKDGKFNVSNNLVMAYLSANTDFFSMPGRSGTGGYKPTTVTVADNYYYPLDETSAGYNFNIRSWVSAGDPITPLSADPLSDLWDPANGKFGAYTITPVEGAAPTVKVGAQRPDMDPATSAVNSAAYGYDTNDLGKL